MRKLGIIHTAIGTVEPLKSLAAELLPDCRVLNFVDDSILSQLAEEPGSVKSIFERIIQYIRFAESVGASAVLEACSSVGDVVNDARKAVNIPVVRIDDAMTSLAVRRGPRIGVAATLHTTLRPSISLLETKAAEAGETIAVTPMLSSDAYKLLMAGDRERHDMKLAEDVAELCDKVDVVVLAQASMASVIPRLPERKRQMCLSSPRSAMEEVARVLKEQDC